VYLYSFFNCGAIWWVDGQHHATTALPQGITWYPSCRRPVGPEGQSGRARKISTSLAFDPQIILPVASFSADYTIPAHMYFCTKVNSVMYQKTAVVFKPVRSSSVETGWFRGSVRTGAENLAVIGVRSPDHPACSKFLY
jgi:hypothetical protein